MRASAALIASAALAVTVPAATAPQPNASIKSTSSALAFEYSWPKEAAAIPALNRRIRAEAVRARLKAAADAGEDMRMAKDDKREFHRHEFSWTWQSAGDTRRLLSLDASAYFFTGGAHPNHTNVAMLWDRMLGREIKVGDLFLRAAAFARLTRTPYCKALDKERLKRRQGEKLGGEFDRCPAYSELAIFPADADRNGRFETLHFVASPYVAGPYVEGEYELELRVTPQLTAAMKPLYRSVFEAQRQ